MNYEKIKAMYEQKSSYMQVRQYLKEAYQLAIRLIESVPDSIIYKIMESEDKFEETIRVNLNELIVSFYNLSTRNAVSYKIEIDFQNEINAVNAKLKCFNLIIESITLYIQRDGNDVAFYMRENLYFGELLGTFYAVFGKNLTSYEPKLCRFTINSEVFNN